MTRLEVTMLVKKGCADLPAISRSPPSSPSMRTGPTLATV
jgi:hypothetical protein